MVVDFSQYNNCLHYNCNFLPVLMSEILLNFIHYLALDYTLHSFVAALLNYFDLAFELQVRCYIMVNCNFHIFSFHLFLLCDMYLYFLCLHLYLVYRIFNRYFVGTHFGIAGIDFADIDLADFDFADIGWILHNNFDFQLTAYWKSCYNQAWQHNYCHTLNYHFFPVQFNTGLLFRFSFSFQLPLNGNQVYFTQLLNYYLLEVCYFVEVMESQLLHSFFAVVPVVIVPLLSSFDHCQYSTNYMIFGSLNFQCLLAFVISIPSLVCGNPQYIFSCLIVANIDIAFQPKQPTFIFIFSFGAIAEPSFYS